MRKKVGACVFKVGLAVPTLSPASAGSALIDMYQLKGEAAADPLLPRRLEPVAAFHDLDERAGIAFTSN